VDFATVLADLVRFLEGHSLRVGLAGALALHAHGISRATSDLDLVVEDKAKPLLLQHLDALGYERLHVSEGFSNHLHTDSRLGRVDFIYVDEHTAGLLFGQAIRSRLFAGVEVLVPRPAHLAAMKIQAMKDDPSRTLRELEDIRLLMKLPGVDQDEIGRYFERCGLKARFDELKRLP
jgi:hypothetical protein